MTTPRTPPTQGCRDRRHASPAASLPTTVVGSLPQPGWLIDRDRLGHQFPPRVRAAELWRIPGAHLTEAQDDATLLTIRAQEEAGLDIVGDGEIRRESYSDHFATALDGLDLAHPGAVRNRSGLDIPVPRVVGELGRRPELADVTADAISVETAQSHLDPATLAPLRRQGIALGVLDLSTPEVEMPATVADRVRRALDHVDVDKLILSSDCGLKYLPRGSAAGKMRALAAAAELVRRAL